MKRRRFYYLFDSVNEIVNFTNTLEKKGIAHDQIHAFGNNEDGLVRHHIQSGSVLETYDIVHMGQEGAIVGFILGFLFSMLLLWWDPFTLDITFWMVIPIWVLFTLHGAWSGGLVGTHARNYRIKPYLNMLEKGKYLVLVDVNEYQAKNLAEVEATTHRSFDRYTYTGSNPFEQWLSFRHAQSDWPKQKR